MSEGLTLEKGEKQLLVDDLLIADKRNAARTFLTAAKFEGNPVTDVDTCPVIFDEAMEKFRMISSGSYGESADGVHWEWPLMDIVRTPEGQKTNMLFDPAVERALTDFPFRDEHDPDPARRYKMTYMAQDWKTTEKYWRAAVSPDALHWERLERFRFTDEGGLKWRTPDASFLTFDSKRACYVFYCRCYHVPPEVVEQDLPDRYLARAIARTVSNDLNHWSEPELVMHVDTKDPPGTEVYHLVAFPYGSHWLGLWRRHTSWPHVGTIDVRLAYSRDGITWVRHRGEPLIPLGEAGTWDRFNNTVASVPIPVGDELWIYYGGRTWRHAEYRQTGLPDTEYRERSGKYKDLVSDKQMRGDWAALRGKDREGLGKGLWSGLGIARLRLDGFASLGASFDGGEVTTVPLILPDGPIRVNVQSRWGTLVVEILEPEGGRILETSLPLSRDTVDTKVAWPEGRSPLAGRPLRLRFKLRNTQLFSFWVS